MTFPGVVAARSGTLFAIIFQVNHGITAKKGGVRNGGQLILYVIWVLDVRYAS